MVAVTELKESYLSYLGDVGDTQAFGKHRGGAVYQVDDSKFSCVPAFDQSFA